MAPGLEPYMAAVMGEFTWIKPPVSMTTILPCVAMGAFTTTLP